MKAKHGFGLALALTVTLLGSGVRAEQAEPPRNKAEAGKLTPEETITLKKDGVRITGRKQGETLLLVWTKDGTRKAYRLVVQG